MQRLIDTRFFTFVQNNSGGYFYENDDVAHFLIVEAPSLSDAVHKMREITSSYEDYCPCCGERWSDWLDDDSGKEEPMVYDTRIKEAPVAIGFFGSTTIIYYYDGTKEKLWYRK